MEKEIFINGNKTNYTISNEGKVYSLNYGRQGIKKELVPCKNDNGYYMVNLYYDKKLYRRYIHILCAKAFIPNPENKPEVNHKDGDKSHNYEENLEWVTEKENTNHAFKTGLRKVVYGENATDAKISDDIAEMICKELESNKLGIKEISKKFSVSIPIVQNIKLKKAWRHISKKYNIENHTIRSKPECTIRKPITKIDKDKVISICEYLENTDIDISDISKILNVTECKIRSILYGNAWTEISKKYNFNKRRKRKVGVKLNHS